MTTKQKRKTTRRERRADRQLTRSLTTGNADTDLVSEQFSTGSRKGGTR